MELLSKALLYSEVEAHWRGDAMTKNCTGTFSLLERHVCTLDPTLPETVTFEQVLPPVVETEPPPQTNGSTEVGIKRKASTPAADETPTEKRARTTPIEPPEDNIDVDSIASSSAEGT